MGSRPSRGKPMNDVTVLKDERVIKENAELKNKILELENTRKECLCDQRKILEEENKILKHENSKLSTEIEELRKSVMLERSRTTSADSDRKSVTGSMYETSDETEHPAKTKRQRKHRSPKSNFIQPMSDIDAYGQGLPLQHNTQKLKFSHSRKNSRHIVTRAKDAENESNNMTSSHQSIKPDKEENVHRESVQELQSEQKRTLENETVEVDEHPGVHLLPTKEKTISLDSGLGGVTKETDKPKHENEGLDECQKRFIDLK